jgi:hypothetical protein
MNDDVRSNGAQPSDEPSVGAGRTAHPEDTREGGSSLAGLMGNAATRLEQALSAELPQAVEDAGRTTAETARKRTQSGQWQNYAFLAVLALAAIALVVLMVRGCGGVVT